MADLGKEIHELKSSHPSIDWSKVKEILCGIEASLELVCAMLPSGMIKTIICGMVGVVKVICAQIPDSKI
jgi:hypothetical protein